MFADVLCVAGLCGLTACASTPDPQVVTLTERVETAESRAEKLEAELDRKDALYIKTWYENVMMKAILAKFPFQMASAK